MKIANIEQTKTGRQERAFGDHIYLWEVETTEASNQDEVLAFCQAYLEGAKLERVEYRKAYRSNLPFNELMDVVAGGYYTLTRIDARHWKYEVRREYID